jgi:hypothetical protein
MPYWHRPLIHRPVTDKLVGVVAFGSWHEPGTPANEQLLSLATIRITNPNCAIPIGLTQLSIIQHNGVMIYEGPFLATGVETRTPVEQLLPHVSRACQLRYCIPKPATAPNTVYGFPDPGASHWQAWWDAVTQVVVLYTVEIEWWAAAQEAHPPIAILQQLNVHVDSGTQRWAYMSSVQMVSLKHYKD